MEFDAAHRVPWHSSKCRHLHGHRYAVEVTIEGPVLGDNEGEESGMVLDFGNLKAAMAAVIDPLDHSLILWKDDPASPVLGEIAAKFNWTIHMMAHVPTAERIAERIASGVQFCLNRTSGQSPVVSKVVVWETPTSKAVWRLARNIEGVL